MDTVDADIRHQRQVYDQRPDFVRIHGRLITAAAVDLESLRCRNRRTIRLPSTRRALVDVSQQYRRCTGGVHGVRRAAGAGERRGFLSGVTALTLPSIGQSLRALK